LDGPRTTLRACSATEMHCTSGETSTDGIFVVIIQRTGEIDRAFIGRWSIEYCTFVALSETATYNTRNYHNRATSDRVCPIYVITTTILFSITGRLRYVSFLVSDMCPTNADALYGTSRANIALLSGNALQLLSLQTPLNWRGIYKRIRLVLSESMNKERGPRIQRKLPRHGKTRRCKRNEQSVSGLAILVHCNRLASRTSTLRSAV
jgi:hypothetical protein